MKRVATIYILLLGALLATGVYRRPGGEPAGEGPRYDPGSDPLVNPASLLAAAPEEAGRINTEDTLHLTLRANPNTLNPLFVSSLYDFMVADVLYAGPFTFGRDMQWRLNEEMVESFEESADHTEFVLRLKPGFTWQDGEPLRAQDVVYSWEQILDPEVPCPAQKLSTEPIKQCVALDDLTVKYVQPTPLATRRWNLLFPIIPRHIFEKDKANNADLVSGAYYNQQARRPVGSGPYRLVEWIENRQITVERWEGYAGKKPYFKTIIFRIIPDDNVALLTFEKGLVDVVDQLTSQKFVLETSSETFRQAGCKGWGVEWTYSYIGWNMDGSNPFFGDRRVRRAMTAAFNQRFILEKISYNLATPCRGIFHPDSWMYNPRVAPLEYDLGQAAALLDEAGWRADERDGWRYKVSDGRKRAFEFTLLMAQESPTAPQAAAIYQQDLRRIGVRMKTQACEFSALIEKLRNHEFQAEMGAWGTGTDPDTEWNLWRSDEYRGGRNYVGYSSARVDELLELGRREFDFERRRAIYQEIQRLIYEDQPYTFLANRPTLAAFNKRIHGVQFSPRGVFNFDPSFLGWWTARAEALP